MAGYRCGSSLVHRLCADQRPHLFAGDHAEDVAALVQIEDDDGQVVVAAEGDGGGWAHAIKGGPRY